MLSEKQLIDLIQALQASNFSASEIFGYASVSLL